MRAAINAWFWNSPTTGSGQYVQRLVESLAALNADLQIILVAPDGTKQEAGSKKHPASCILHPTSCLLYPVPCPRSNLGKVWFEQVAFPRACTCLGVDVAHVPYWAPPLAPPVPTVITIHDLIPLVLPEYRGGPLVRLYTVLVSAATSRARLVLADSEASGGKCLTLPSAGCDGQIHNHIAKDEKDPKRTAGSAELAFTVEKEGEYCLWIRKWWCCSCGDSFSLQVDDGKAFTFGDDGTTPRRWSWLAHKDADGQVKFKLTAGAHKLTFRNRGESGFRIDQVLFTADPESGFVPQGKERPPQKPKAPAGG